MRLINLIKKQSEPATLVEKLLAEPSSRWLYQYDFKKSKTWNEVDALSPVEKVDFVMDLIAHIPHKPKKISREDLYRINSAFLAVVRKNLPFEEDHLIQITDKIYGRSWIEDYLRKVVMLVEKQAQTHFISDELKHALEQAIDRLEAQYRNRDNHRIYFQWPDKEINKIKIAADIGTDQPNLIPGEAWSDMAIADIKESAQVKNWVLLLQNCSFAHSSKPSIKWLKENAPLVEKIGAAEFNSNLNRWLREFKMPRTLIEENNYYYNHEFSVYERNGLILRGLIWLSTLHPNDETAESLAQACIDAYKKIPGVGPRSGKLGNACIWALSQISTEDAIAKMAILKVKLKNRQAQKTLEKAASLAAEKLGISPADLEELSVPTYGLTEAGRRVETLSEYQAILEIDGNGTVLQWIKPDGKPQKSVPKVVKENHANTLKELKQAAKDIKAILPSQKARIEATYLSQKSWLYETWLERYHNHLLIGSITNRLIWNFIQGDKQQTAMWNGEQFTDVNDQAILLTKEETAVKLWHPLDEGDDHGRIVAWRDRLERDQIQQPFKQAYREIYLLTDAEINTRVYSNRFAAHIIRQHQFNALCQARGWHNQLRLMVDDWAAQPSINLPAWNLRGEFWIDPVGEDYGTDTNETGTYYYLSTDQVRFYSIDAPTNNTHATGGNVLYYNTRAGEPIPLEQIPPLVLSEVMRDVDLFVGVASVGNDPTWNDGGPDGRHQTYWHSYSFGDLSTSAKTRKAVLERIVPRLKIAEQATIDAKFLNIKGSLRTYKIHMGSGNILMEPNDQYLCIVPGQMRGEKGKEKIFLPFEGDRTLAIILSKALLLAEDHKIKDQTIMRQIKRSN